MRRMPIRTLPAAALFALALLLGAGLHPLVRAGSSRHETSLELVSRVLDTVRERYFEPVDETELLHAALRGMLASLDDYSEFYAPEDLARLNEQTTGEFGGIGVFISRDLPPMTIDAVMPGFPADRAGLLVGDRIIAVDGRPLEGHDPDYAIDLVRGPLDTIVRLRIVRPGEDEPLEQEVSRERIPKPSVVGARLVDPEAGIGYLRLATFQKSTVEDFDRAMEQLRRDGMESLVLDLRGNEGGLFDAARIIANRFISEGILVSTKGRAGGTSHDYLAAAREARDEGTPLVVLVDGGSASASEIVAGALQDHGRAILIGTKTYGKGLVQTILPLDDYGVSLKLTTSEYVTPGGQRLERPARAHGRRLPALGLEPDVIIPAGDGIGDLYHHLYLEEVREVVGAAYHAGEDEVEDPQLDAAVRFLHGEPLERPLTLAAAPHEDAPPAPDDE